MFCAKSPNPEVAKNDELLWPFTGSDMPEFDDSVVLLLTIVQTSSSWPLAIQPWPGTIVLISKSVL